MNRSEFLLKSIRGINTPRLYNLLSKSADENFMDTLILVFHIRDCRGNGKGERDIGRKCLIWMFINFPYEFFNVTHLISHYGRWDDLLYLFPNVLDLSDIDKVNQNYCSNIDQNTLDNAISNQKLVVSLYGRQLIRDKSLMLMNCQTSLAAKWFCTENGSFNKKYGCFRILCSEMNLRPRQLRKLYLTPLRKYIGIVERDMCTNNWGQINYSNVPKRAMGKLKAAFEKNDATRFHEWKDSGGNPLIFNEQSLPTELVKITRLLGGNTTKEVESHWAKISETIGLLGAITNSIAVIDTSESMTNHGFAPLDTAMAVGLLVARHGEKGYRNRVITFTDEPTFVDLEGCDNQLSNRWKQLRNIKWGGRVDLLKVFELILEKANEAPDINIPDRVFVMTDMDFENADLANTEKTYEAINDLFEGTTYDRPQIVFWNTSGRHDLPIQVDNHGTMLVSGVSPGLIKTVFSRRDCSVDDLVKSIVIDPRYDPIRNAMKVMCGIDD